MASKDTKLNIIVEAQNRAGKGLNGAKDSLDRMNVSAERISSTLKQVGRVGAIALTALSAASAKLINDSAQSLQIEESYRRMTEQIGISSDDLLKQLRATSAGTVSSTDLMLSANRAMALGVGDNMETITELMEIARLKGRALGLDTTQAFNDIVTGIGRGSPLILDNLGITIKLGEAQEMYAEQLGKTASELTDAEKKQALLNAVMESGRKELEAAGEVQTTTAEKLQAMKATMADTADTIGRTLIPAVTKLLEAVQPIIEKLAKWAEENPKLTAAIIGISLATATLAVVLGAIGLILPGLIALFGLFTLTSAGVIAAIAGMGFAAYKLIKIFDLLKNHWDDVWLGIKLTVVEAANSILNVIEGMINGVIDRMNSLIEKINSVIRKASSVTGIDVGTLNTLSRVELGGIDTAALVDRDLAGRSSSPNLVITGNSFLSEDAAEQMGDLIMNKLKLSNAL